MLYLAYLKMSYKMTSFGKRVRDLREAKKLTQQELGHILNTSYAVVGKYERDEMKPSIDVANKVAKALGTTLEYLVGEDERTNIFKDHGITLGKRIENLRNEVGLSMNELAKRLETSHVQIANYERDEQIPSAAVLLKIANELKTTCDYLLKGFSNEELSFYFAKIETLPGVEQMKLLEYLKERFEIERFKRFQSMKVRDFINPG